MATKTVCVDVDVDTKGERWRMMTDDLRAAAASRDMQHFEVVLMRMEATLGLPAYVITTGCPRQLVA